MLMTAEEIRKLAILATKRGLPIQAVEPKVAKLMEYIQLQAQTFPLKKYITTNKYQEIQELWREAGYESLISRGAKPVTVAIDLLWREAGYESLISDNPLKNEWDAAKDILERLGFEVSYDLNSYTRVSWEE